MLPPAGIPPPSEIIATAATMGRDHSLFTTLKEQNAAQLKIIDEMLGVLNGGGGGHRLGGRRANGGGDNDDATTTPREPPPKGMLCKNYNKVVMYNAEDCYSLARNTAYMPAWWKAA